MAIDTPLEMRCHETADIPVALSGDASYRKKPSGVDRILPGLTPEEIVASGERDTLCEVERDVRLEIHVIHRRANSSFAEVRMIGEQRSERAERAIVAVLVTALDVGLDA